MNQPGDDVLAGTGFSVNHDGHIRSRGFVNLTADAFDGGAASRKRGVLLDATEHR